ncbi:MAG: RDD family protein [Gammaproteobacteria bacterium]
MEERITLLSADATELALQVAGIGSRCYAFIIDWHIRLLLALAWIVGASWLFSVLEGSAWPAGWFQHLKAAPRWSGYTVFVPPLLLFFFYHPVLEVAMSGRTPGKRMAGVRIIGNDGNSATLGALLIRNVFRLIDVLPGFYIVGLTVALLHPRQLRIGDIAAGTLLVYEERPQEQTLQRLTTRRVDTGLTPAAFDVLDELLARWSQLERPQRIRLAEQFLHSAGRTLPASDRSDRYDRALRDTLQQLAMGRGA